MLRESVIAEVAGKQKANVLKRKVGWIVTIADEDELTFDEGTVRIVPFHKFKPEETLAGNKL